MSLMLILVNEYSIYDFILNNRLRESPLNIISDSDIISLIYL